MATCLSPLNITLIGDEEVGKTCLLKTYVNNLFTEEFTSTVAHSYHSMITVDDKLYSLTLLDTGGKREYERLRRIFYANANCILLCYSINKRYTFEDIGSRWWPKIRKYARNTPVVLVGTRLDLCSENPEECVSIAEALLLKERINACAFVECSSKEMNNLRNVFVEAVRAVETQIKLKRKKNNKIKKRLRTATLHSHNSQFYAPE